jgi:hypothetical protein
MVIFGPKRDEVTGDWRKLHNEELLHNLYSSGNMIRMMKPRRMRWAGNVARLGEKRNACKILVGKPVGKTPLKRPRHRWESNITMDLREIRCGGMDWIHLAQYRDQWRALLSKVTNFQVAHDVAKFLSS